MSDTLRSIAASSVRGIREASARQRRRAYLKPDLKKGPQLGAVTAAKVALSYYGKLD